MSAGCQLELPSAVPASPAPAGESVAAFERRLLLAGGWVTARELLAEDGLPFGDGPARRLRRLASASPQIISGDAGYCHVVNASHEEIRHCADRLRSQMREMGLRVITLLRTAHQKIGA